MTDSQDVLKSYFDELHKVAKPGDAREESYYPALKTFLEDSASSTGKENAQVTVLPKKTEAGNPDFRLWNGTDKIIGYIEAKKPSEEYLDKIQNTEQLKRYRQVFPNLILTNFIEFRLYRYGELVDTAFPGGARGFETLKMLPASGKAEEIISLLGKFFAFSLPKTFTAETLAVELAKRTRFLRNLVEEQLVIEMKDKKGNLLGFYKAFRQFLIADLEPVDFSDLYAQTITYGLFAARTRTNQGFNRRMAFDRIPHTIGILRDLFRFVSLGELPKQMEWIVDDISDVLATADAPGILNRYYHDGKGSDPIVHFYETFLAEYDPDEREKRGVYYTPEPVVSYIVRSLHEVLKDKFGKTDGLATEGVTLLDPAAGTMTFIAKAAQEAVREFEEKYGSGGREDFIKSHILKNFYAFELMMAPYAIGHLKMSFFLDELGHKMSDDERVKFYLTNTLEIEDLEESYLPGMSSLSEESHLAGAVKKEKPVLVILGNPPYSGHSSNKSVWISDLINEYKMVDGKPLGEKNPKWLQDDYVKFLRFAQWKIDQAGSGVVGMITNHSYLDNPTFRGMRESLMRTFNEIHIIDLHGNSLKKEKCPDGSPDKNVFDIRQGVAIVFFIKYGDEKSKQATVKHTELWGSRREKYDWLEKHQLSNSGFVKLNPHSESYLYIPINEKLLASYNNFPSVKNIFPINSVGIVTSKDNFVIDFDKAALTRRIRMFLDPKMPDELVKEAFKLKETSSWNLSKARSRIQEDKNWEDKIVKTLYRPFDSRWLFYHQDAIERSRQNIMRHMENGKNMALITCRQIAGKEWFHSLVSNTLVDDSFVSNKTKERGYAFPLYLYPEKKKEKEKGLFYTMSLFEEPAEYNAKHPNIDKDLFAKLAETYGKKLTPEDIFYYIYAVLYTPEYREKYAEFLKMDFPRIPFTADKKLFAKFAKFGEQLSRLHLMDSTDLDTPIAKFEGKGDSRVAKNEKLGFRYDKGKRRVYINPDQYFAPVPENLWEYQVGGYQVLHKWLKDRKERILKLDDIRTYCRIATALQKTIKIQQKLNNFYPEIEKEILPC